MKIRDLMVIATLATSVVTLAATVFFGVKNAGVRWCKAEFDFSDDEMGLGDEEI
jgi:hypothetical protein